MKTAILFALMLSPSFLFCSCEDSSPEDVVDLDQVLNVFVKTAKKMPDSSGTVDWESEMGSWEQVQDFADSFAKTLNESNLLSTPVGVSLRKDGAFLGFEDRNANNHKERYERDIFTVEVDTERNRLIASDLQKSFRRDQSYSPSRRGFLTGVLIGNMLSNQRHAGVNPSRFSKMTMQSKGNRSATSKSGGSARSSGGSRSFRTGK